MGKVIKANFDQLSGNEITTESRYQYDYGMILKFGGAVTLPQAYEVHFALDKTGDAVTQIGGADGVTVPDSMFTSGAPIYAWVYLHDGETDGYTQYTAIIPVIKRAAPSDLEPTPVQQSAIDQAIAALGVAVEQTAADVEATAANAENAQASAEAAANSAAEAAETAEGVETNVTAAQAAKAAAESARDRAEQAETAAASSETNAAASATAAGLSETAAKTAETGAQTSATAAANSAAAALTSEENANGAMMSAYSDANRADTAADTATSAKSDAVSAKNAAVSAKTAAETAAGTATTKATAAANSATAAANSATAAAGSATEAATTAQGISDHLDQIDANTEDIEGLKEDLNVSSVINHELAVAITSDMLELGRIDDSGNPVAHSSRCRTKDFIPVNKGDTIIPIDMTMSLSYSAAIFYYDKTYTFLTKTKWLYFGSTVTAPQIVQNDGYIKILYGSADFAIYDGKVTISRTANTNADQIQALENKFGTDILPIPVANLRSGYWTFTAANEFRNDIKRGANYKPIKVRKGDEAHFTKKNVFLTDIGLIDENGNTIARKNSRNNMPFKASRDGYFCITFYTPEDTGTADLTTWDNAITIKRASEIGSIEDIRSADLYNGYINSSDTISNHAKRLVNWNPIHANKGDIVRINRTDIMMNVIEFDVKKTRLAETPQYITAQYVGGNYPACGDYIVQNDDCWVMCVFATSTGITEPETFLPVDYDKIASVIHINATGIRNNDTATDTLFRFPKAARKGSTLNTSAIVSQGATVIGNKLWAAVDDTTDYIQVINLESGAVEKTITHNLGHCNSLDYCKKTDTLITMDSNTYQTILLYPNVSAVDTSIDKTDCISIALDTSVIDFAGTVCFGQDEREIFLYTGSGSNTPFNLYRYVLGYENGVYTGTAVFDKLYTGIIRDNIDTYATTGMGRYAQDSCYDGYFYLAYGSSGHNFLVIDLNDRENTYRVVGNYLHHEYKDDRTEYGVEPEGVCLHNGKIYCLSRQNTIHASYFNIFDR